MAVSTLLEKNWAVDYQITGLQFEGSKKKDEVIIDALNTDVKKRIKQLEGLNASAIPEEVNTSINIYKVEQGESADVGFEAPKFSKDFTIFDSNKTFIKSQQWIGHIEEITKDGFVAKLTDLSSSGTYEYGEFDLTDVSPEDRDLVTIGAAFYWSIGRSNTNGQIRKESVIRFQRIINWTMNDFDSVADRADDLINRLKWE